MGVRNKERRAVKARRRGASHKQSSQKQSQQQQHAFRDSGSPFTSVDSIALTLMTAADDVCSGRAEAAQACGDALAGAHSPVPHRVVERAGGVCLTNALGMLWSAGWQPRDIYELTRRRLKAPHVALVVLAVAEDDVRSSVTDLRWRAQLEEIGATAVQRPPEGTVLGAFAAATGLPLTQAVAVAIELVGLVLQLPALQQLIPPPGSATASRTGSAADASQTAALARVRALLAKAEATEFPEEADALSAKAQELMTRHSLDQLLQQVDGGRKEPVSARRMWLDAPYTGAKAMLVGAVADANRSRAVWAEGLGCITVIGHERDLAAIEMLVTSLLTQATRAMVSTTSAASGAARSKTRSYRQSFLVAYASRIGERLSKATDRAARGVDESRLLPALVADSERVKAETARLFPDLATKGVSVSNSLGWAAGRAAADLAMFDVHGRLDDGLRTAS